MPHRLPTEVVCESPGVLCGGPHAVPSHPTSAPQPGLPALVDVAHVIAEASMAHMQPDGWAVLGVPTGFLADPSPRLRGTVLLGRPATVRFTPVAYHWSFGDGRRLDTVDPGVRWGSDGNGPFSPGPTTHVFTSTGPQQARLITEYRAEYRYADGSWVPLPGTLARAAPPLLFTVLKAKTLLVAQDCSENVAGPGCSSR